MRTCNCYVLTSIYQEKLNSFSKILKWLVIRGISMIFIFLLIRVMKSLIIFTFLLSIWNTFRVSQYKNHYLAPTQLHCWKVDYFEAVWDIIWAHFGFGSKDNIAYCPVPYIYWIGGLIKNCHNITMNLIIWCIDFFKESTFKLSVWVLATDTETNLKKEWLFLVYLPISRLTDIVTDHCLVFPFPNFSTSYAKEGATYNWLLWVWWLKITHKQHICWSHLLKLPLSYLCNDRWLFIPSHC